jgi:prevent-host-death family protein
MAVHAVELAQAGGQLASLIEEVGTGAEVVITHNGQPLARLVPASAGAVPDRVPGSARGLFTVPDDFDAPIEDFREFV